MKLYQALLTKLMSLIGVSSSTNIWRSIREPFSGAWQRNITADSKETLLTFSAVFACVTGIATDIAKLRIKLDENKNGIWEEITSGSPWLPVLRKPNHYQTRIQFIEQWMLSILLNGNAYILKQRDNRGIVNGLYVLAPTLVTPLVSENGEVYYRLQRDYLSKQLEDSIVAPAYAIIHDRMNCLWHPLIGVSPLYACALSATMGNKIQNSSTYYFNNRAMPGGVLTAPGTITDPTAKRLREDFEKNFGGENVGKVLVAGDGLKFEPMAMTAEQSQLADQLKYTVEDVARAFHYPMFKLGGNPPPYAGSVDASIVSYYTDCLQSKIENIELCLDEGLGLPANYGTEMDLDGLMRMDSRGLAETNSAAVGGGWMSPDEARYRANLAPVPGGSTPYLQQQMWSLAQLSKRTAAPDGNATVVPEEKPEEPEEKPEAEPQKALSDEEMELLYYAEARGELFA